jgi:hypothetical protein
MADLYPYAERMLPAAWRDKAALLMAPPPDKEEKAAMVRRPGHHWLLIVDLYRFASSYS